MFKINYKILQRYYSPQKIVALWAIDFIFIAKHFHPKINYLIYNKLYY